MPEINPSQSKANPAHRRILVMDDEDTIRDMLQLTLEAEGFQVKPARDGRNVLMLAQKFEPHLIVSDVMMPGGGGYEVLRTLQSDPGTKDIPVIVVTGYAFDDSTKEMMKQEPNVADLITKPLRPAAFVSRVHGILNTKSKDEQMIEKMSLEREEQDPGSQGSPFGPFS